MNIGFIGGTGWIGVQIVKALIEKGLVAPQACWVSNRSGNFSALAGIDGVQQTTDNDELVQACDVVFLCVRPQHFKELSGTMQGKLLVSVMAGVTMSAIAEHCGSDRVVRTMPNAAIEVQQSVTPWLASEAVSSEQKAQLQTWLSAVGMAFEINSEDQLNFLTGLSGSSHGSIAYFQRAMVQAAIDFGLDHELAKCIVYQVFFGNSVLMQAHQRDPHKDVDLVIDYNGTTAQLCRKLNELHVDQSIAAAIMASYEKASADMSAK